ncbi:hypothetical protein BDW59DRAFT_149434 [Aspergillus cavernicola]|uniref:Uncharacterized protein n=1 Tax=Aspergillus cavernicola TaxID=176166 RepID=A0ABR4I6Y9_9EURO
MIPPRSCIWLYPPSPSLLEYMPGHPALEPNIWRTFLELGPDRRALPESLILFPYYALPGHNLAIPLPANISTMIYHRQPYAVLFVLAWIFLGFNFCSWFYRSIPGGSLLCGLFSVSLCGWLGYSMLESR